MILEFRIKKEEEEVFKILSDMQSFAGVHPLLYKTEQVTENKFKVYEKVKMGFLNLDFSYFATITVNERDKSVNIKARVHKINYITMDFTLKTEGSYTIVNEEVQIKSPLPIKSFMEKLFREQHTIMFDNINKA